MRCALCIATLCPLRCYLRPYHRFCLRVHSQASRKSCPESADSTNRPSHPNRTAPRVQRAGHELVVAGGACVQQDSEPAQAQLGQAAHGAGHRGGREKAAQADPGRGRAVRGGRDAAAADMEDSAGRGRPVGGQVPRVRRARAVRLPGQDPQRHLPDARDGPRLQGARARGHARAAARRLRLAQPRPRPRPPRRRAGLHVRAGHERAGRAVPVHDAERGRGVLRVQPLHRGLLPALRPADARRRAPRPAPARPLPQDRRPGPLRVFARQEALRGDLRVPERADALRVHPAARPGPQALGLLARVRRTPQCALRHCPAAAHARRGHGVSLPDASPAHPPATRSAPRHRHRRDARARPARRAVRGARPPSVRARQHRQITPTRPSTPHYSMYSYNIASPKHPYCICVYD